MFTLKFNSQAEVLQALQVSQVSAHTVTAFISFSSFSSNSHSSKHTYTQPHLCPLQPSSQNRTRMASVTVPLIINGEERNAASTFDVVSPYTNRTCWTVASATSQDAITAVESAEAAFPKWSQTKPTVRRDILLKAADILESRLEEYAEYMRTEMGADVGASQFFVVPLAISMLRDIAGRITSICGSVPVVETEGQSGIVYKEPMGVILGIVPWYVRISTARKW